MSDPSSLDMSGLLHLLEDYERRFLELGAALRAMKASASPTFSQILKEPSLGRRRAYYFMEIDRVFGAMPAHHKRLTKLGWSKCALVARHAHGDNLEELLHLAEVSTVQELRSLFGKPGGGRGARALLLQWEPMDFQYVRRVLLENGAYETSRGMRNKEVALLRALAKIPPAQGVG